jgi:hypothetical protein
MKPVVDELETIADRLRSIRGKHCEPKNAGNPSYHALSTAVAQINRAIKAFQADVG